jgi:hypothetical protein
MLAARAFEHGAVASLIVRDAAGASKAGAANLRIGIARLDATALEATGRRSARVSAHTADAGRTARSLATHRDRAAGTKAAADAGRAADGRSATDGESATDR